MSENTICKVGSAPQLLFWPSTLTCINCRYFSLSAELALSSWTTEDSNALSRCGHCDNCLRQPNDILRLDVTHHMWQIVQIASAIYRQKGQVTLRMLVDVVRGNKPTGREQEKLQVDLAVVACGPVLLSKSVRICIHLSLLR